MTNSHPKRRGNKIQFANMLGDKIVYHLDNAKRGIPSQGGKIDLDL